MGQHAPQVERKSKNDDAHVPRARSWWSEGPPAWAVAAVLALTICAVYGRAVRVPFIYDDRAAIAGNRSITSLWPLFGEPFRPGPLTPDSDLPISGRPLVNLTLALNFWLGGLSPIGYHVVNIAIHFCSSLLLWAILRRALGLSFFCDQFANSCGWLSFAVALLWTLHPLQTEAVIYTTQRTELMVAFFYLATLYWSLRYWAADKLRARVTAVAIAAVCCACGMASKEVMASAPLMILLFERTFVAGSLRRSLRNSWPLYAALTSTWGLLLVLCLGAPHSASAGFGIGVSTYSWWLTQCKVLLMYLKLVVWPFPLLINYEWPLLNSLADAWMYVAPVAILGIITLVLLYRNNPVGYLGTWLFAILSPTSVVPIVQELAAERRMYLPLAALMAMLVIGGYGLVQAAWNRWLHGRPTPFNVCWSRAVAASPVVLLTLAFGLMSACRLVAYDDETFLWHEVLSNQPDSVVAHSVLGELSLGQSDGGDEAIRELQVAVNLDPNRSTTRFNFGQALVQLGKVQQGIEQYREAIRLAPENASAHSNLGFALVESGRIEEGIEHYRQALRLKPNYFNAHNNLGLALIRSGHAQQGIDQFREAIRLNPDDCDIYTNLGGALVNSGQIEQGIEQYRKAIFLKPDYFGAHTNLGNVLMQTGHLQEALQECEIGRRLSPDNPSALNNLALVLMRMGRDQEALEHLQHAVQVRPEHANSHANLAALLYRAGRLPQATEQFEETVKANPNNAEAHDYLGLLYAGAGEFDKSLIHYNQVLRLRPNSPDAQSNLGEILRQSGQPDVAVKHFQDALQLQPNFLPAYANFVRALAQLNRSQEAVTTAEKGIAIARANGQEVAAGALEDWLQHYKIELRRDKENSSDTKPQP